MSLKDNKYHPAVAVKDAILARSGVYYYTRAELLSRDIIPTVDKELYSEYRPAGVLVKAKDMFKFSAVTQEHTDVETHSGNYKTQMKGVVGDTVEIVTLDSGEIALKGRIAFYDQDMLSFFERGSKETSADYISAVVPSKDAGYDYVMTEIKGVNGIAIVPHGRGGSAVRVMDKRVINYGGDSVGLFKKRGVLSALGIGSGRTVDGFKPSISVIQGVKKFPTLDAAGQEKLMTEVMAPFGELSESDGRDSLLSAVRDCFSHPVETVAKEKEVSLIIDGLYARCVDSDKAESEKIKNDMGCESTNSLTEDTKKEDKKKKVDKETDEDDKKELNATTKDAATLERAIDAAIAKAIPIIVAKVTDSIKGNTTSAVDAHFSRLFGGTLSHDNAPATHDSTGFDNESLDFLNTTGFGS